ncbi:hypothetical protein OIU85_002741 [Salix viminalis]|uniref:non-specific serine/threonine protein kinase n=1 Tax=Salix viminalis TaxID=40686 RepID=A0A9Q0ZZB9_SALVM|nr:hypothetical protein OIU85_002741 [Salix viminalis]
MARRIYLFLLVCFCASHALAADTLYQGGDSLNSSNTLVSKNGLFTLGFTSLGSAESSAGYLGIWYKNNNDTSHPFCLANRKKSTGENSGVLAIDGSGNMKLTYSGGDLVDFYSSLSSTTNLTAVLEDSDNFVLKDKNSCGQQDLWRRFDDPKGKELVIKRGGEINCSLGPLTSNNSFEKKILNKGFLGYSFFDASANLSLWQMEYDGNFTKRGYDAALFKGNNADAGSEKMSRPSCRSSRNSFELRSGTFVNPVRMKDDNSSLSISDCMDICWNDCPCSGVTTRGNNANNTGCTFYYGNFTPDPDGSANQYYVIVGQVSSGKKNCLLIILAPVGFVSIMGLAGLLWYQRRRKLREGNIF